MNRFCLAGFVLSLSLLATACSQNGGSGAPAAASSGASSAPGAPAHLSRAEKGAAALITPAAISGPLRFLSDDLLEGRAPGTRGDDVAIRYVASEMEAMGLSPGGDAGTFVQKVPLVGVTAHPPAKVTFTPASGAPLALSVPDDLVVMDGTQDTHAVLDASDVVFVGYGIVAPEYQWDDYAGADVRGKVVLVMNDDPSDDPALFAGKTRLWYGRWDYKYLEAAKHGAAGAIVIHTTPSAAYPWQVVVSSNMREKFDLPAQPGDPHVVAKMWATEDASRKIAALGGKDLDALRKQAQTRGFHATSLGVKVAFPLDAAVRRIESANVLGVLPGSDPALATQAVVFTAHHDHLGVGLPKNGDAIYNGAVDNASGVAALLTIARAAAASRGALRPKRSILFMAVTAEEQGLLGSAWYCAHPTFPAGRIAADLNIDGINRDGKTSDLGFTGLGKSSLDELVTSLAAAQGRTVHGDPFPEKGAYYRSDQFSFAKIGVPGIYARGGPSYIGRPPGWGEARIKEFETLHYHQPSDEYDGSWDFSGAVEDLQLLLVAGVRIASAPELPAWRAGDEFEAARKAALAQAP
jgi:Zn-dependent M28 family amino/carboxypeptidase